MRTTAKSEVVNRRQIQHERDEQTGQMRAVETVVNDLTVGTYDVTVSVGPAYRTMRQEAADAMVQFGQAWPKPMEIAGDKVVKSMDWPGADEIAERIKRTIPPELRKRAKNRQRSRQKCRCRWINSASTSRCCMGSAGASGTADKDRIATSSVTRPMLTHR